MALSSVITKHSTAWVELKNGRLVAVRYSTLDDELVCFGDEALSHFQQGDETSVAVHEIADGAPLESFRAKVREVAGEELNLFIVSDIHGNAPEPTSDGSNPYETMRRRRRFLGLRPIEPAHQDI